MLVDPHDIHIGDDRIRLDVNDGIQPLCDSIQRLGQLQPILVDGDWNLIDGGRRLQACILLGRQVRIDITTTLDDAVKKLEAQFEANECREPFKPSEIAAYSKRLRAIKEPEAAERKTAGHNQHTEPVGKFPKASAGRTEDVIAKPFGISGKTLEKIEKVAEQGVPELMQAVDAKKVSVDVAAKAAELPVEKQAEVVKAIQTSEKPKKAAAEAVKTATEKPKPTKKQKPLNTRELSPLEACITKLESFVERGLSTISKSEFLDAISALRVAVRSIG